MMLDPHILSRVRARACERLDGNVGAVHCRSTLTLEREHERVSTRSIMIAVEVPLFPGCHVAEEIEIPAHASGYMLEADQILGLLDAQLDILIERRDAIDEVDMRPTRPLRVPRGTPSTGYLAPGEQLRALADHVHGDEK